MLDHQGTHAGGRSTAASRLNGAGEMLDSNVAYCVEALCNKGCKAVRDDIAALESGQRLPETRELRADEVRAVLAELKSIMAVYGGVCRSPI
jgi:hypothetical protein